MEPDEIAMDDEAAPEELVPGLAELWSAWCELEPGHAERLAAPATALEAAETGSDSEQRAA